MLNSCGLGIEPQARGIKKGGGDMTVNQILYQARRKAMSNYFQAMQDPHGPGRASSRQDSAESNARLGWNWYLEQHNLSPYDYPMPNCHQRD